MLPAPTSVPIPAGLKSIKELPKQHEAVINMIRLGNALIPRAGLTERTVVAGECRGSVSVSGTPYFVMGDRMIRELSAGVTEDVGPFIGTGHVNSDQGIPGLGAVMVDSTGGAGYVLTDSSYTQITSDFFPPSRDVAIIDGIAVAVPVDGGPCAYSEAGDYLTWAPENVFDAETSPDINRGVRNFKNYLYVMGGDTIEPFVTTGNSEQPFQRVDGGTVNVGLVSGHIEYGKSFVFLGKRKDNNFGVFMMGSGEAPEISNETIVEILSTYSFAELETTYCSRLFIAGVDVVMFHLPRHTLAYYGEWAVFKTGVSEADVLWIGKSVLFHVDQYLIGCDGAIATFEGLNDLGLPFSRGFDTFARTQRGSYFRASNLEFDCLTGQSTTEKAVGLSLSKDGRIWSQTFWRSLGTTGQYQRRVNFNMWGGLGTYESFMGIRVRSNSDVSFAIDSMQMVLK